MTSPILPLRAAIRAACLADAELASLMDGAVRLYDEPPGDAPALSCVFGETTLRDWSTGTERGHEQEASVVAWARPGSAAAAVKVVDRMAALLDDAALALPGHRLVRLSVAGQEVDRDPRTNLARATLRLVAITEVAG